MIKVTVVVPTYRSSEHLDDLVASLDAQTLPQDEFEVLLIDDGSPDGTLARLERIAAERPNHRVIPLPHSGWPSGPRNRGIDEARGEYVVFLDHDDRIFPDGLRAAHALAARAGADVLDGKESKSNTPGWAMRDVWEDVENAIGWRDRHPLLPMNPHKMFRTAHLREQGIRFPEGGRQIWEDIHFDIQAHARAQVVSLLVETPFYFWNRPGRTTSATFEDDLGEFLEAIARVFRWIDEELDQERFAELRLRFLAYQLHMRVLPLFAAKERFEADRERIRAFTAELMPRIPVAADAFLDPWRRIKTALLRASAWDLVEEHEATVPRLVCVATADDPHWGPEGLRADVGFEWTLESRAGVAARRDGARVELALAPAVAEFAREHGLSADVTAQLRESTFALDRRSRAQKIDWMLSCAEGPALSADGAAPLLVARAALHWELADDGPGRLIDGPWDFYVRTVVLGTRVVRQVRTTLHAHRWAAVAGRLVVAYRAQNGCLSVDVGQTTLSVVDEGVPVVRTVSAGATARFVVELPHVQAHSALDLAGELVDESGVVVGRCRIVADDGRARLEGDVPAAPGRFGVRFGGRVARTWFAVGRSGEVRVAASRSLDVRQAARAAWQVLPDGFRRRVWRWRHRR